jgi:hypothetical protein
MLTELTITSANGAAMPKIMADATKLLVGRTITDADDCGFSLNGNIAVLSSQDDEGNDQGVIDAQAKDGTPILMQTLVGRKIAKVLYLLDDETNEAGPAILLDDGSLLIALRDEEGNGLGVFFIEGKKGMQVILCTPRVPAN